MWISPNYQDTDFTHPWSLDQKIIVFEDKTLGWKLNIAHQIMNGRPRPEGGQEWPPIPHAGYAALDIVMSYFEMIAKYVNGYDRNDRCGEFFRRGVLLVFPSLSPGQTPLELQEMVKEVLDMMYEGVRCGLYHSGVTHGRIILTGDIPTAMGFDPHNGTLAVNPLLLIPELTKHFANYIADLRNTEHDELRRNFVKRFDYDTQA